MANQTKGSLWVVTGIEPDVPPGRVERGLGRGMTRAALVKGFETDRLKQGMTEFLGQLEDILSEGHAQVGEFEIAEITVSAQISADGKICLLGSGVDLGVQGGLRFVLKRRQS